MQAFSVRQLKSNPSTVLKVAESDAMAVVTSHQQPTALVVGSAAQIAGLPPPRFLEILASLKIPVVDLDSSELNDELTQGRRWLGQTA